MADSSRRLALRNLQDGERAVHVARLEVEIRRFDLPPPARILVEGRSEPQGLLDELGGRRSGAARPRLLRRLVERLRDLGARPGGRQREMACALLGVRSVRGEPFVERALPPADAVRPPRTPAAGA